MRQPQLENAGMARGNHSARRGGLGPRAVSLVLLAGSLVGCSGWLARSDGLDPQALPEDIRPDYAVFAQRCSKCHSLARPLSSGIDDDDYWAMYVARMRRQPASGISQDDTKVILRFLHYYSEDLKAKKASHGAVAPPQAPAPPTPAATASSASATPPSPPMQPPVRTDAAGTRDGG